MPSLRSTRKTMFRAVQHVFGFALRIINRTSPRSIVVYYGTRDFERKAHALCSELTRAGLKAKVRTGASPLQILHASLSHDLWIGYWNKYPTDYLPESNIFINGEQLRLAHWHDNGYWLTGIARALEVWDYSRSNEPYVAQLGGSFRHVPFGYSAHFEDCYQTSLAGSDLPKDIDVLFYGGMTDRRRVVLDQLKAMNLHVHEVSRQNPAFGKELDLLLARAKVVVSIFFHADPEAHLADYARLDYLLANRIYVVQERPSSVGTDPDLERVVTTCRYEDLATTCAQMVRDDAGRARISEEAHRWFRAERALSSYIPFGLLRGYLTEGTWQKSPLADE